MLSYFMVCDSVALVIFDGLRADMVVPALMPNLCAFAGTGIRFPLSRAVFPTETRVNIASMVTGCLPRRHGIVANYFYDPHTLAGRAVDTGSASDLALMDAAWGGRLLDMPSLGERLMTAGRTLAVVSTGSTGAGYLLHHRAAEFGQFRWSAHGKTASSAAGFDDEIERRFGPPPRAGRPNTARIEHATTIFIETVMERIKPAVGLLWYSDPDSTYHYCGIGSAEAHAALLGADAAFGRLLDWCQRRRPELPVIVLSDHGHVTGRARVPVAGLLDAKGIRTGAGLDGDVDLVVTTGAPVGLNFRRREPEAIVRVVRWLVEQPWCGLIFTAESNAVEAAASSFAYGLVGAGHARTPDLMFTFADDDAADDNGMPGRCLFDQEVPVGGGIHGGLHPRELANVMIAAGGPFRAGHVAAAPVGIVDVAPTVLALLGLPAFDMDGRVLVEALDCVSPATEWYRESHLAGGRRLDRLVHDGRAYLDGGYGPPAGVA